MTQSLEKQISPSGGLRRECRVKELILHTHRLRSWPRTGGGHIRRALQKLFNSNLTYYTACTVAVTGMDTCSCEECVKLTYACKSLQVTTGAQVYLKLSGSNETALQQKLLTVKSVDSCKAILTLDVQLLLNFNTILDTYGIPFILTGRRNPRCR